MSTKNNNILIVKNRAMGDAVMGLATVSYIKKLYPESHIIYGVPAWVAPLFSQTQNDADEILPISLKSIFEFISLFMTLRKKNVRVIFEMHQAGRTKKAFSLYSLLTFKACKYFFHNHHVKSGTKVLDQGVIKSVIQRDLDGAYSFLEKNKKPVPNFFDYCPKLKIKNEIQNNQNKIIIGIVATRNTKKWELTRYAKLMRLIEEFYQSKNEQCPMFIIPLSFSSEDEKLKTEFEKIAPAHLFKVSQTPLDQLPLVISGAKLYIGNDTGLKHIAVSLDVKTYTFFGPEPPNEWHPYDIQKHEYFYLDNLECRTKDAHYCGLSECETMLCLKEFSAGDAFNKIKKDLN